MVFTCGYNITIQTITVVGILLMHGLVLLRSREDASVLTSAIASLYCLYLQWSALSSDSNGDCNRNLYSDSISWMQIVFGMIFTGVSLFIISGSTKNRFFITNISIWSISNAFSHHRQKKTC